ncbi:MAG: ATP-binding protein [Atopobiaceae bacterium]|jgi:two-component system phosphate regulon sensor histidine kinase PhoR|nr:ATP-binding protein [Atopobiaceae bacterium]MCI2050970.1 ATP-binding protein [Atopobiaceae bacterium]
MAEKHESRSLSSIIFIALTMFAVGVAVVATLAAAFVFHATLVDDAKHELTDQCATIAASLNSDDTTDTDQDIVRMLTPQKMRATLVAPDGTVIYDTKFEASSLPNHADRQEIQEALSSGTGETERPSDTAGNVSLYYAQRLDSGDVLRLSEDRESVTAIFTHDIGLLVSIVALVVLGAWAASRMLSKRLVKPILDIDTTAAKAEAPYRELEPLVDRLNDQQAELIAQMDKLRDADAYRLEFTANVTHELKTPIASIQGAAELIRDGIARPEDIPEFAGRIYSSARRLSSLVSDILTLSKMDESERAGDSQLLGLKTECDLYQIAGDVTDRLQDKAKRAGVRLTLEGQKCMVVGNAGLLDEMVSNLCDNAIRYNRVNGKVYVWVYQIAGRPTLSVSDTGIGIPEEAQPKVFERFYRVDKSRSRSNGGTGLGLAIVKHAAAFHNAKIDLKSKLGEGTTITVTFPSADEAMQNNG